MSIFEDRYYLTIIGYKVVDAMGGARQPVLATNIL
jgi:hypothetical protein